MQITGADATSSHLLVWNSSQAEVHAATGAGGFNRTSSFDWTGAKSSRGHANTFASSSSSGAQAMAIHGSRIYRSVPGRALIEVTDLDGVVTDALSYEEAQGEAGFLDCNGESISLISRIGNSTNV